MNSNNTTDVEREFDAAFKQFKSGAIRSGEAPRYDLIPWAGLRRLAKRYAMGAAKYGEFNWIKGLQDREFVNQFKAHLIEHVWAFLKDGCVLDDNLAAIAWGAFALMEVEERYGHSAVYPTRDIERNREAKENPQAAARKPSGKVRANPAGGSGRGGERDFGLIATGTASSHTGIPTTLTIYTRKSGNGRVPPARTPKGRNRTGRGHRN